MQGMDRSSGGVGGPGQPARLSKSETTKAAIRAAAAALFGDRGFARTGVREIAAAAGVDPALVNHHFGSKEALFLEALSPSEDSFKLMDGPVEDLGYRVVRALLENGGAGRRVFSALIRASDSPVVRARLEQDMNTQFVEPVRGRLSAGDADLRARIFASQLQGLMTTLWIIQDAATLAAPREQLVLIYGRALQETLTGGDTAASRAAGR